MQPLDFIPLAEETGLILPIGQWVLCQACSTMAAWEADPRLAGLGMAVNVSARQFHQPDFVHNVREQLRAHGIAPSLLKLEITESMLLDNIEQTIETMQTLRALGGAFRWTTLARATPRSTMSSACRWTRSRSTSPLCATS